MWRTLDGAPRRLSLATTRALTNEVETLTNDNADVTREVSALRLLLADGADGEELLALLAGAKAANFARRLSLVAVKREGVGRGERRSSKRAKK